MEYYLFLVIELRSVNRSTDIVKNVGAHTNLGEVAGLFVISTAICNDYIINLKGLKNKVSF